MADLLNTDAMQQLEVAFLGSLALQVVVLLAEGLTGAQVSISTLPLPPQCQFCTATPTCTISTVSTSEGGSSSLVVPVLLLVIEPAVPELKETKAYDSDPCWCTVPTLVGLCPSSTVSTAYLLVPPVLLPFQLSLCQSWPYQLRPILNGLTGQVEARITYASCVHSGIQI